MQTSTLTNKTEKKGKPFLDKLFQLLMKKTNADKRIAFFGRDPFKTN